MAATALAVTDLAADSNIADVAGVTPDAVNGNSVSGVELEQVMLRVKNADSASHTCTVKAGVYPPALSAGQGDLAVVVVNGTTRWIGPFTSARFAQADGSLLVDWSASTSVTVTAFVLPPA